MSNPILSLNSSDWRLAHSNEYRTSGFIDTRPIPIPSGIIDGQFFGHNLIVFCTSLGSNSLRWRRGCILSQALPMLLPVSAARRGVINTPHIIPLRQPILISFPNFSVLYDLRIDFYPWFEDLYIEIWEHMGVESDTTTESLKLIENKLNTIINRLP